MAVGPFADVVFDTIECDDVDVLMRAGPDVVEAGQYLPDRHAEDLRRVIFLPVALGDSHFALIVVVDDLHEFLDYFRYSCKRRENDAFAVWAITGIVLVSAAAFTTGLVGVLVEAVNTAMAINSSHIRVVSVPLCGSVIRLQRSL